MGFVAWLIVGGVEIVDAAFEAGVHDGEILIWQGNVNYHIGAVTLEQFNELWNTVSIDAVGGDVGTAYGTGQGITLGFVTRGYDNFAENLRVLGAFMRYYGADTAGADNDYF